MSLGLSSKPRAPHGSALSARRQAYEFSCRDDRSPMHQALGSNYWLSISDDDLLQSIHKVVIAPMGFCFPGYNDKGGDLPPCWERAQPWH